MCLLFYYFRQLVTFDYGMRDRNPIDEVRFYGKNNPDKPMIVRKEEVITLKFMIEFSSNSFENAHSAVKRLTGTC